MRRTLVDVAIERVAAADDDTCVEWPGYRGAANYGRVFFAGRARLAHRVMYELLCGPIPEGHVIDHLCRNTSCINPAHMEPLATVAEHNTRTALSQETCRKGHPRTPDNYWTDPKGFRQCRPCSRRRTSAWRASKLGSA